MQTLMLLIKFICAGMLMEQILSTFSSKCALGTKHDSKSSNCETIFQISSVPVPFPSSVSSHDICFLSLSLSMCLKQTRI